MPLPAYDRTRLTPADELRALTGLPAHLLADLFGVSRTAFYKWIDGATPRDVRYVHLLDVLVQVRDADKRIGGVAELGTWLRTPVSPGGKTPLDYLHDRRFTAFRGFALREASDRMALGIPRPALGGTKLSAEERAAGRRRINPPPRIPDLDDGEA